MTAASDIALTLTSPAGIFEFSGAEVPEQIAFGGKQLLSIHKLIGGRRIINSLGADDAPLSWSGIFVPNVHTVAPGKVDATYPLARSRFRDSVRRHGTVCPLALDEFSYQVIISDFVAPYQKPFRVSYTITFAVIQDQTALITSIPVVSPIDAVQFDMHRVSALAACGGDSNTPGLASSLSSSLDSLKSAVAPVANGLIKINAAIGQASACASEVGNLVTSSVAALTAPFAQLQANVTALIANSEGAITSFVTLGGLVPVSGPAKAVAGLISVTNAHMQLMPLYEIRSVATRMQLNTALIGAPTSNASITQGGGNLMAVAATHYGDASQWPKIAAANNITDPFLTGNNTLKLPA